MARKPTDSLPSSSPAVIDGVLSRVQLSDRAQHHPLVAGHWFYTFPKRLYDSLCSNLSLSGEDRSLADLDLEMAQAADQISGCVGFRNQIPILDETLRRNQLPDFTDSISAKCLAEWQTVCPDAKSQFDELAGPLEQATLAKSAYVGWLLTNPEFLTEFRRLQTDDPSLFRDGHLPPHSVPRVDQTFRAAMGGALRESHDPCSAAVRTFCQRWRLAQILGPATLAPLSPQYGVPDHLVRDGQAQTSGTLLNLPDISPLPDRDTLRRLVEAGARQTALQQAHLREWTLLVQSDTQGKQAINRFARWHPLQHYLRLLYSRYGSALQRNQQRAERIIGEYLGLSDDQLRIDLRQIRGRLGHRWFCWTAA